MLPANMAKPCPQIAPLESDNWYGLSRSYVALAFMYGECAARVDALLEAWPKPAEDGVRQ